MRLFYLVLLFLLLAPAFAGAQAISINTDGSNPAPSAILDVKSTDKGVLMPRMTTAQRTAITAANALLVFDADTRSFWFFDSPAAAWREIRSGNIATLADADGNTTVQVEKNPNEDIIRFDLGGSENMVLRKNASGIPRLELTTSNNNTFVGSNAGLNNSTGSLNTATGINALGSNTTGIGNAAFGASALVANTTGAYNAALGSAALNANTNGAFNTATGTSALFSNTTGSNNVAQGAAALLSNTTGNANVAIGLGALYLNTNRSNLVAVGDSALYNNGAGTTQPVQATFNTAVGSKALFANTTGRSNTSTGGLALLNNTTGDGNTAAGVQALRSNTDGFYNTAIGYNTLFFNTGGVFNTALGANADALTGDLFNTTSLGYSASVNISNKVRIGNTAVTVIEGQVDWTFPSDARFKYNIRDAEAPGLAFIRKLRPVTYQFDTRKFDEHLMQNMPDSIRQRRLEGRDYRESSARVQTGFLAQEVEKACKDLNFDFSGLHVPTSDVDNYGLAYGSFVPLLVKGMQEQQVLIEAQQTTINALKTQLDAQAALLQQITTALQTAGIGLGNR